MNVELGSEYFEGGVRYRPKMLVIMVTGVLRVAKDAVLFNQCSVWTWRCAGQ